MLKFSIQENTNKWPKTKLWSLKKCIFPHKTWFKCNRTHCIPLPPNSVHIHIPSLYALVVSKFPVPWLFNHTQQQTSFTRKYKYVSQNPDATTEMSLKSPLGIHTQLSSTSSLLSAVPCHWKTLESE